MKKRITAMVMVFAISCLTAVSAFAGTWGVNEMGFYYEKDAEQIAVNEWIEDAGKSYFIGPEGYMLTDTYTPDGYAVGVDGVWDTEIAQITADYGKPQNGLYVYSDELETDSFSINMEPVGESNQVGTVTIASTSSAGGSYSMDCTLHQLGVNSYYIVNAGNVYGYIYNAGAGILLISNASTTNGFLLVP